MNASNVFGLLIVCTTLTLLCSVREAGAVSGDCNGQLAEDRDVCKRNVCDSDDAADAAALTESIERDFGPDIYNIVGLLTDKYYNQSDSMAGEGWNWLADVTDTFGNRMTCSSRLESAIDYLLQQLSAQGMDNVHKEPVHNLPNWVRGEETATLLEPREYPMAILGIGGTIAGDVVAEAVVVRNFRELDEIGQLGQVEGKIVVYNQLWEGYGISVAYREHGADRASAYGAVGVLVRSVTPYSQYTPHTGDGTYNGNVTEIPMACLTVEDAEMLYRMQQRNQTLKIHLRLTSETNGTCTSHNTVFELTGSKYPDEIVLLSGHFDSWDVGQGAMDDAGAVASMWAAVTALQRLGYRPLRTIRVVAWTCEERGYLGSQSYFNHHNNNGPGNETFIFVSESDEGAFRPTSLNAQMQFAGTSAQRFKFQVYVIFLNMFGIPMSVRSVPAASVGDVAFWAEQGVPGVYYINADQTDYYFRFHHSNADTMEVFKPDDIDYTAAAFASLAHIIANIDEPF